MRPKNHSTKPRQPLSRIAEGIMDNAFWMTVLTSFVLLVHNGQEPLFLFALVSLPILIILFLFRPSLLPTALFLIIMGALGRYTRYFRQNYASDTLPAIRDYIGYFLAGKNVYQEIIFSHQGLTPFTYLPFSLFWYLPAQILGLDLRFFEMLISSFVPLLLSFYTRLTRHYLALPLIAIVALTPFLLDLSADGSNDNSAIALLLTAFLCFAYGEKYRSTRASFVSALLFGLSFSFKHYAWFVAPFFLLFLWNQRAKLALSFPRYLVALVGAFGLVSLPFILASPVGFFRSLTFIQLTNYHAIWGWNLWVGIKGLTGIELPTHQMWLVRTAITGIVALGFMRYLRLTSIRTVAIAAGTTLLVNLMLSNWTTYAYFTYLIPLLGLSLFPM